MWKVFMARVGVFLLTLMVGTWALFNFVMDWVGKSTVVEDFEALREKLPGLIQWLYTTPWWTPALIALALGGVLVWLSLPRRAPPSGPNAVVVVPVPDNATEQDFRTELKKAHGSFRQVLEHIRLGGVPSSIPMIEEQVARFDSVQISLEKRGIVQRHQELTPLRQAELTPSWL